MRKKLNEYRSTGPTEHEIQSTFFEWLELQSKKYPELDLFYAIPNGARKSIATAMKFKREGLKAGVPDCHLPLAWSGYAGLWIEFKSKRGKVSEEQWKWITALRLAGHRVEICRSLEEATEATRNYLNV